MNKGTEKSERLWVNVVVHTLIWDRTRTKLLLLERANTGYLDGCYTLPGGHLNKGESLLAAARREACEEVGLELLELEPCCVLPFRGGVNMVFQSYTWSGKPVNAEPHRCSEVAWFIKDKLPDTAVPWLTKAIELHDTDAWYYDFSTP